MPHNFPDPDPSSLRWFTLAAMVAALMSLATDVANERGGSFLTRLARAILNGVFALAVAVVLLRWIELSPSEVVVLSAVLGSLGREFALALLVRFVRSRSPKVP